MTSLYRWIMPIVLLTASNAFMTTAWYYHLKKHAWSIPVAILISWLIALPEYALQVPANRIGHISNGGPYTAPQLKVVQEAITLVIFSLFSIFILKEKLRGTDWAAFALIMAGVVVSMYGRASAPTP